MIDNVMRASNSICEDGLPGSLGYPDGDHVCSRGTDLSDCGMRDCVASGRRLSETAELEVWVSRSFATFGTRCATTAYRDESTSVLLRCLEGEGSARGTFVFLRGFYLPGAHLTAPF